MRERAINVKSRLVLQDTPDLGADEDDDQTQDDGNPVAAAAAAPMAVDAPEDGEENGDGEAPSKRQKSRAKAEEDKENKKKAKTEMAMIPTPPIFEDSEYDKQKFLPWKPPEPLIKFVINTGSELNTCFDYYELKQDDLQWLQRYNEVAQPAKPVTEEQMECLLDLFEKEAAYKTKMIDPSSEFPVGLAKTRARDQLQYMGVFVEHIYEYWRARRKVLRKALMRKFQIPPHEPGPHVAFVPRVPSRRASSRNPRKNDGASFRKMEFLKEDFLRVLDIIARLKRRELIKRHLLQVQVEEFDNALERTHWASQLAAEKEAALKARQEAQQTLDAKKRQLQAERGGKPLPPVHESAEIPGYFLGPFPTFPEAYLEYPSIDPNKSEKENCGALLVSTIPRSNYVGEEIEDADEKKESRLKRAKAPRFTKPVPAAPAAVPRPPRVRRKPGLPILESSSSESDIWEDDHQSDEEYCGMLEKYLLQHGRDPTCLSPFLAKAFDDISLGVPLEKRNGDSAEGPLHFQSFPWGSSKPAPAPPEPPPEQTLHALQTQDNYAGYARGRIGRCGRAFFDVYWKGEDNDNDSLSSQASEDDVPEIDLSAIDEQFTLHNGVVGKAEPLLTVHAFDSELVPE